MSDRLSPNMRFLLICTAVYGIHHMRDNAKRSTVDALVTRGLMEPVGHGEHRLAVAGYSRACELWDEQRDDDVEH